MRSMLHAALLVPSVALAQGYLESPQPNAVESGAGLIFGWHCTAREVAVYIDGNYVGKSGVGSLRTDTASLCGGKAENGFSLLYNFNAPAPGTHRIDVYVDGALFTTRQFQTVRSGGVEFLQGVAREVKVEDFPVQGSTATLTWSQAKQSFVVTGFAQPPSPQSAACEKTAMVTGTWLFNYTIITPFTARFSFSGVPASTGNPDIPCMLMGSDEYGNRDVAVSYVQSLGEWLFLDQGATIDRIFTMKMTTPSRLDGQYYQGQSGKIISSAYTAYALKTVAGGAAPGVLSAPEPHGSDLASRELEQTEDAVIAPLRSPAPAPGAVQRVVEQARQWLRDRRPGQQ